MIGINAQIARSPEPRKASASRFRSAIARRSLAQLVATGRVSYAYIGIESQDVTPGLARRFRLGVPRGALVTRVRSDTPGGAGGLARRLHRCEYNGLTVRLGGDVIVRIGKTPIRSSEDVSRVVTEDLAAGQRVDVIVLRDGKRRVVGLTLSERPQGSAG